MALFTAETAVIAAKRSHAPESARFIKPEAPQPLIEQPQPAAMPADAYIQRRIARVRSQLERLDGMIETEEDPQKIDRLGSAIARLAELERQYSGRPLPGSFRPQADKSSRRQGRPVEVWSDETPQPVVSGVPVQAPVQPQNTPPVQGPENG